MVQGYNLFAPTFEGVAKSLSIQDIKLNGSEGWASDMIFVLDDAGLLTGQSFSWNCPDNGFDDWCWVDSETGEPAVATIKAGQGLYLYADTDGLSLKLPAVIPAPAAE